MFWLYSCCCYWRKNISSKWLDEYESNNRYQLKVKNFVILWRQDWFVILRFNQMIQNPANYRNKAEFERLKVNGQRCVNNDRIDELRNVVSDLMGIQINDTSIEDYIEKSNIIKGWWYEYKAFVVKQAGRMAIKQEVDCINHDLLSMAVSTLPKIKQKEHRRIVF